jgi:hypothetical protein
VPLGRRKPRQRRRWHTSSRKGVRRRHSPSPAGVNKGLATSPNNGHRRSHESTESLGKQMLIQSANLMLPRESKHRLGFQQKNRSSRLPTSQGENNIAFHPMHPHLKSSHRKYLGTLDQTQQEPKTKPARVRQIGHANQLRRTWSWPQTKTKKDDPHW